MIKTVENHFNRKEWQKWELHQIVTILCSAVVLVCGILAAYNEPLGGQQRLSFISIPFYIYSCSYSWWCIIYD